MSRPKVCLPPEVCELVAPALDLLPPESYLVGGSVRDLLLDKPLRELDLATSDAPVFARVLADRLGAHFALLDADRGVARILFSPLPRGEGSGERATSPLPRGEGPGVRAIDVATLHGDIDADLARRDFTIDALAAPLRPLLASEAIEVIDPHGGVRDLQRRELRMVSEQALIDDPLRLLRAVRIATQLDFHIESKTAAAVRAHAPRIAQAAAERQRDELSRSFGTPRAAQALRLLDELSLLELLLPEVTAARGVEQPKEHYYDVFGHLIETVAALDVMLLPGAPHDKTDARLWHTVWDTLAAWDDELIGLLQAYLGEEIGEGRSRATLLKLAGLLHDVAKPETRAPDETGRIRFFGHAERGAETARAIMQRLRFSRRETDYVATLVEEHLRPAQLGQPGELPTRRALFRFFRDTGDAAEGILLLSLADALAARGPRMTAQAFRGHVSYIGHILAWRSADEEIARPTRLLTGDDLMAALSIGPGPEVGRLLSALEEAQASGDVTDREGALDFVRQFHEHAIRDPALTGAGA